LHIITKKGKGYALAEEDEFSFHAVKPFDPITGKKNAGKHGKINYTDVFSEWICDAAEKDMKLHGITPAMCEGSGLIEFSKKFPKRYHDVGIAEQHAVTFAAGLACAGKKPVVAIIAGKFTKDLPQGTVLGHAGAIVARGRGGYDSKARAFAKAGVAVVRTLDEVPDLLKKALSRHRSMKHE